MDTSQIWIPQTSPRMGTGRVGYHMIQTVNDVYHPAREEQASPFSILQVIQLAMS
jgi:hypothetical protein